jgi:hypothetical protein
MTQADRTPNPGIAGEDERRILHMFDGRVDLFVVG